MLGSEASPSAELGLEAFPAHSLATDILAEARRSLMMVEINNIAVTYLCSDKRIAAAAVLEHVCRDCLRMKVKGKLRTLGPCKLKPHSLFDRDRLGFAVNVSSHPQAAPPNMGR